MNTRIPKLNREEVDALWHTAMHDSIRDGEDFTRYHFAAIVAATTEQQMITDGWRHCAKGQRTTQFCGLTEQAIAAEREAIAKMFDGEVWAYDYREIAAAIRARGVAK